MPERALFDIWELPGEPMPWRVQLVGYIGQFPEKAMAERYVESVKIYRKKYSK